MKKKTKRRPRHKLDETHPAFRKLVANLREYYPIEIDLILDHVKMKSLNASEAFGLLRLLELFYLLRQRQTNGPEITAITWRNLLGAMTDYAVILARYEIDRKESLGR